MAIQIPEAFGQVIILPKDPGINAPSYEQNFNYLVKAYNAIGFKVIPEEIPFARNKEMLVSNKLDADLIIMDGSYTETEAIKIPHPIRELEFYRACLPIQCLFIEKQNIRTLKGVTIRGSRYLDLIDPEIKQHITEVQSIDQIIKMLVTGRADYTITEKKPSESNIISIQAFGHPLVTGKAYHYIHPKNKKIAPKLLEHFKNNSFEDFQKSNKPN